MNRHAQKVCHRLLRHDCAAIGIGSIYLFRILVSRQNNLCITRNRQHRHLIVLRIKAQKYNRICTLRLGFRRLAVAIIYTKQQDVDALVELLVIADSVIRSRHLHMRRIDKGVINPYRRPKQTSADNAYQQQQEQ